SEAALRAMGAVLAHNASFAGLGVPVVPDFVIRPAQILTKDGDQEDQTVVQPADDDFWQKDRLDLWRGWALAQVAPPSPAADVWVGVVDQAFAASDATLTWDQPAPLGTALGAASDFEDVPWHGTECGSILIATANDSYGAAGAALLGTATSSV